MKQALRDVPVENFPDPVNVNGVDAVDEVNAIPTLDPALATPPPMPSPKATPKPAPSPTKKR